MGDITTTLDGEHDRRGHRTHPARAERWALILAGGEGTRLRDLTRRIAGDDRPKQFCPLLGEETLLDETRRRVAHGVSAPRTVFSVTAVHEPFYAPLLADVGSHQIVVQPANRGTAPAIFYALQRVAGRTERPRRDLPLRPLCVRRRGVYRERVLARCRTMPAPWAEVAPPHGLAMAVTV